MNIATWKQLNLIKKGKHHYKQANPSLKGKQAGINVSFKL